MLYLSVAFDFNYVTRDLCTRLRTGGFSAGKQLKKNLSVQEIAVEFVLRTFYLKDSRVKFWVEGIMLLFLDAVATVDVLTASN